MVSRLVASVWCKPTRAAGVRRAALYWAVRRMALHTMAIRAAAAGLSLCFVVVCHSPSRSGSLPCLRGDRSARRRVFSSVLCAARGQRVLRGTEWTLCAPIGCVALLARRVRFWRRARLSDRRACDPNPSYTAHARAAASAVRCLRCCASLLESRGAARAGSSLGRWRCGSCVAVRLIALGFARLGRLPG